MKHVDIITVVHEAIKESLKDIQLSPLPENGSCTSCGHKEFLMYQVGHSRTTSIVLQEDGDWLETTSGFDDYTDVGTDDVLICQQCDELFVAPEQDCIAWC